MTLEEWRSSVDASEVRGIKTIACSSIADICNLEASGVLEHLVFRGQKVASWPIRSSFDRLINHPERPSRADRDRHEEILWEHCRRFGLIVKAEGILAEDIDYHEFASIGQHYGLATNFIDWTFSFRHSLFFAYSEPSEAETPRVVWGFRSSGNTHHLGTVLQTLRGQEREISLLRFLTPTDRNNLRMREQRGLFSRVCGGGSLDALLFDANLDSGQTIRIILASKIRVELLEWLTSCGVTASRVFPDLTGVASHVNSLLKETVIGYE